MQTPFAQLVRFPMPNSVPALPSRLVESESKTPLGFGLEPVFSWSQSACGW